MESGILITFNHFLNSILLTENNFFKQTILPIYSQCGLRITFKKGTDNMFRFFRERRRNRTFTRAFKTVAKQKFRDGDISEAELAKCMGASSETMKKFRKKVEDEQLYGGIRDWDWDAIIKWFQTYFIPLFKTLLSLLMALDSNA